MCKYLFLENKRQKSNFMEEHFFEQTHFFRVYSIFEQNSECFFDYFSTWAFFWVHFECFYHDFPAKILFWALFWVLKKALGGDPNLPLVIIIVIKVINNIARVVITEIRWPNTTLDLVLRKRMLRQEEVWGGKTTKAIVVGNCIHLDSETRKKCFLLL